MRSKIFLKHFVIRLRGLAASPGAIFMLLLAGLSSLMLWPWFLGSLEPYGPAGVDLMIHVIFIFVWPMMVAFATSNALVSGGPKASLGVHALPALPIGRRLRALGDALAAMLVALAARLLFAELALLLWGARELTAAGPIPWSAFVAESLFGTLLMLPGVLAWVSLSRGGRFVLLPPLLVALISYGALLLGIIGHPFLGPAFCVLLAIAVLSLPEIDLDLEARLLRLQRVDASRYRRGLAPETRFRRDRWAGPLRRWGLAVAGFVLVAVVILALSSMKLLPDDSGDLYFGFVYGLSFSMIGLAVFYPMGVHLFQTDRCGGGGMLMTGSYRAAWSTLPVRPEAVLRGVYLHGLVVGFCWVLWVSGFSLLAHFLGQHGLGILRFFLPLGLAVPAVAGLLTCTAAGDRRRGLVAFLAVICVLPAHIGTMFASRAAGLVHGSPIALAVDLTVLALLGAIGGLPPLVHLRRDGHPVGASAIGSQHHD
jgi:hypothetical protein